MKLILQISVFFAIFGQIFSYSYFIYPDHLIECPATMKRYFAYENGTGQFCDCEEQKLYYPAHNICYNAYRQGPCPSGYYLTLYSEETTAKCVKNPCGIDGVVPYQGKCQILWAKGKPCESELTYLGINDDHEIECSDSFFVRHWDVVESSKSCPNNSILTATNEDNTNYICECKPTFLYSAKYNSCYQAYRQHPCSPGNYFILPEGESEPRCERNPCHQDGLVPFEGGCHEIFKFGPACPGSLQLEVDKKTFQLHCGDEYVPLTGAGGIINAPAKTCRKGSRRIFTGCKHVFH